ncbi:hypothetical protein AB0M80_43075 [Amycolatopsis sp. NPDC051045]|uniref:hypothetical protein n=1 Tax=Amycolatopsis sp. NPDC051045 TaxID=3156922 RepID=UPI003413C3C9
MRRRRWRPAFGLAEPSLLLHEPAEPMVSGRGAAPIVELQHDAVMSCVSFAEACTRVRELCVEHLGEHVGTQVAALAKPGFGLRPVKPGITAAGMGRMVFGLAVGVHVWLGTPLDAKRVSSPGTVLRQDRAAALSFTLAFTVSMGLFYGLALRLTQDEPTVEILDGSFDVVPSVAGGIAAALLGRYFAPKPGTVAYGIAGALISGRVIQDMPSVAHAVVAGGLLMGSQALKSPTKTEMSPGAGLNMPAVQAPG